jgi:hypothetical protein
MTTILGLDLGKFKSVACHYDPNTLEARYQTITDPDTARIAENTGYFDAFALRLLLILAGRHLSAAGPPLRPGTRPEMRRGG